MKFGQLIKYSMRNIFLRKIAKIEVGRLVPGFYLFCFFFLKKKALQASGK